MKVGFTGTQAGMTAKQKNEVWFWLNEIRNGSYVVGGDKLEFHHGGCIGADEQAHELAGRAGPHGLSGEYWRHVHWALDTGDGKVAQLSDINECQVYDPKPPLDRNRDIVDAVDVLLVAPRQRREVLRSGTWATYRYAQKIGRTCILVWP